MLYQFADRIRLWIAPPIDADNSRCEFDCRRLDCTFERYDRCHRRLRHAEQVREHHQKQTD